MTVMTQKGITKKQSALLQGVAILLMIYHHFFNDPSIYGDGLFFWNIEWVTALAWFGKICVGLFAFVSGYGMCRSLERSREAEQAEISFFADLRNAYVACIKQITGLLIRYWCVLILFLCLFLILGKWTFDVRELLGNLFCYRITYNGAFWYVEQYAKMLMLLPLVKGLYWKGEKGKKGKKVFYGFLLGSGLLILLGILCFKPIRLIVFDLVDALRPAFLAVFVVGYLLAKHHVFEWLFEKGKTWNTFLRIMAGCILLAIMIMARVSLADSPAYAKMDFVIVPFFVLGVLLAVRENGFVGRGLEWLGKRSLYFWLTHIFVYDLTMHLFLRLIHSHVLFFFAELVADGIVAWGLSEMERFFIKVIYQQNKRKREA